MYDCRRQQMGRLAERLPGPRALGNHFRVRWRKGVLRDAFAYEPRGHQGRTGKPPSHSRYEFEIFR